MKQVLEQLLAGQSLSREQMQSVMQTVMTGGATDAQIGALLVALRAKGETVDEISGAAQVMRELSARVELPTEYLVDTCGTGGDGSRLFNVSTATAFVASAAGARVAKHGNRSVSSTTGSADLLEAAGVALNLTPEAVAQCVQKLGVGFMFAPGHHSAMRHAIGPRKEMGIRTLFNLLGPLTNPAGAPNQVLGVFDEVWCEPLAEVLKNLGSRHVMVVHSDDGLDELSIAASSQVCELKDGVTRQYTVNPADFGLAGSLDGLSVESAEESLTLVNQALSGQRGNAFNMVALNAGAAIYVSGISASLEEGVERAIKVMESGEAADKLSALVKLTVELSA